MLEQAYSVRWDWVNKCIIQYACWQWMAGLSGDILYWCSCYQDLLLTHLWSTALWDWSGVGARHHITQPPHTPGRCVCVLSSSPHCNSHVAHSMVSPTVVLLLHSAHRHRRTLSEPHTNVPLTMSTEPTAHRDSCVHYRVFVRCETKRVSVVCVLFLFCLRVAFI